MSLLYPIALLLLLIPLYIYQHSKRFNLLYLSTILIIISLSRPIYTKDIDKKVIKSKDLIIAVDISRSMMADDLLPNRFEYAKELIIKTLDKNPQANITLFVFTKNPLILSAATTDQRLIKEALNSINPKNILTKATDFRSLLLKVAKLKREDKDLLIFSDGGDELDLNSLLEIAKKNNITIYAIATATKKGSIIKDEYSKTLRDKDGHIIISRLNPMFLSLADNSGGEGFLWSEFDGDLSKIEYKLIKKSSNSGEIELFWIPLLIATLLFLLHYIKIPKKLLLSVPLISSYLNAGVFDWYHINKAQEAYKKGDYKEAAKEFKKIGSKSLQSELNLANSYYQAKEYKKALSIYQSLKTTNPHLKKLILFKMANCEVMRKRYSDAKLHYSQALAFGEDRDILFNLKLIANKKDPRRDNLAAKSKEQTNKTAPTGKNQNKSQTKKSQKRAKSSQNRSQTSSKNNTSSKKSQAQKSTSKGSFSRPLGYKAYDTINRGYIDEIHPW